MWRFAEYLDNKIYYMLLFTVAVIPLHQEFTAFCVGDVFGGGFGGTCEGTAAAVRAEELAAGTAVPAAGDWRGVAAFF